MPELHIHELDTNIILPSRETALSDVQDPLTAKGGSKIVVIGKPGTGKSWLISSLIYEKRDIFPVGMVFSGTEDSNYHYRKIFPSSFVYNKLIPDRLVDFIKRQKTAKRYLENPWGLVLIDDCTDDTKIFSTPLFNNLFKNGRHYSSLLILSLQYGMDFKPYIRTNIDGTFILRETNMKTRKILYENYAGVIPSFKMFCEIMDQLTNDYTALYVHNRGQSNELSDCIFYYRASPVPEDFRFGAPEFWEFHEERFNTDYVDPVEY
jgi:hypothetical protein